MKKMILGLLAIAILTSTFVLANGKTGGGKKTNKPAKGTAWTNTKDSTYTFRHSDSATLVDLAPAGYKVVEVPR